MNKGLIKIKSLGPSGLVHLESMVVGSATNTLDDGEAATIAHALEEGTIAVIDERKAIRICNERFPKLELRSTVDIFSHPKVTHALGQRQLANALFKALQDARMRVLPNQVKWVVNQIGAERAAQCLSLPASIRKSKLRS